MADYKVQFEVFEGPLDLLLYLVRKQEVDIYQVNLTKLATQFIEYVDLMRQLDLDIAGEFLVMAATLMYIKSKELLPVDQQADVEEEEDAEDPRWELIRRLVEYKKFKDASAQMQLMERQQADIFPRQAPRIRFEAPPLGRGEASLFDLVGALNVILKRHQEADPGREIVEDRWTVSQKIEMLRERIGEQPRLRFADLFAGTATRMEVVVTFLAVLELVRLRQILAVQTEAFGEIEITAAPVDLSMHQEDDGGQASPEAGVDQPSPPAGNEPPGAAPSPDAQLN
jgi:segregation and condensation protein A